MSDTVFIARCSDKDHSEDAKIVTRLSKISGISDAFETHFRFKGIEYCIAAKASVKEKRAQKIADVIDNYHKVKAVKILTEEDVPF